MSYMVAAVPPHILVALLMHIGIQGNSGDFAGRLLPGIEYKEDGAVVVLAMFPWQAEVVGTADRQ